MDIEGNPTRKDLLDFAKLEIDLLEAIIDEEYDPHTYAITPQDEAHLNELNKFIQHPLE